MSQERIAELEELIVKAAEAYYVGASPIMSDEKFDRTVDELCTLSPDSFVLHTVGWGAKIYGADAKLLTPIQVSLPKIRSIAEYKDLGKSAELSPKIDGMSVVLNFDTAGYLFLAVTRGDGTKGKDITMKITKIHGAPTKGAPNSEVRGELYIPKSVFNRHLAADYANPRNAVAGIVNSKSFDLHEHVHFIGHGCEGIADAAQIKLIKEHMEWVPLMPQPSTVLRDEYLTSLYEIWKNELDYPLDGIVLDSQVAFKVATDEVEAEIEDVEWNMSPRGQYVPRAVLKGYVDLYGTKVCHASLFNADYVREAGVGKGAKIMITKANEIIPYVTEILVKSDDVHVITHCTKCGNELVQKGVGVYCVNVDCLMEEHLKSFVSAYFTCFGVTDSEKIMAGLDITSFEDIAALTEPSKVEEMLLNAGLGFGKSKAKKIAELFDWTKRKLDPLHFISALGIHNVGRTASKKAEEHLSKIPDSTPDQFADLINAPKHARLSLNLNWKLVQTAYELFKDRLDTTKVAEEKQVFTAKLVMTGSLSEKKASIAAKLAAKGIEAVDKMDKTVDYLVQADASSTSNKTEYANKHGIKIISEQDMRELFGI